MANGSGPYYYLPKMQSHLEARLWNDIFVMAQDEIGIPQGTVKSRLRRAREALHDAMARLAQDSATFESTVSDFDRWAVEVRERVGVRPT